MALGTRSLAGCSTRPVAPKFSHGLTRSPGSCSSGRMPSFINKRFSRTAHVSVFAQYSQKQGPRGPVQTNERRYDPNGFLGLPPYGPPMPGGPPPPNQPPFYAPPPQQVQSEKKVNSYLTAVIAAAFVAGLGLGVYYDSEVNLSPSNVSSTEFIDRNTPNAEVCMANGYSASVFDMKLYVTFNPFNVYTAQPVIKSGCVLRRANVGVLERENLVTQREVDMCKSRMNTFAYMGDLGDKPDVACVYHSEEAENQYLDNLKNRGGLAGILGASPADSNQAPKN